MTPLWQRCPLCEDFWCDLHHQHVFDCPCPTIDEFLEHDCDPYAMTAKQITNIFPHWNIFEEDFPSQENAEKQENRETP